MDIHFAQPLSAARQDAVLNSGKVSRWLQSIQDNFDVARVTFDGVYFFGAGGDVGYVMARAEATLNGRPVPGLALIRGDSVAIKLDLLDPDNVRHTVIVEQARLPVGETNFCEIPAGMIDRGVFRSKAIDEINEEIGADFEVTEPDLVPLAMTHPSPGGCDESICIFLVEKHVSHEAIRALEGRETGVADENEAIRVYTILNDDLPIRAATDGKSLIAYYAHMAQLGMVARPTVASEPSTERTESRAAAPRRNL